MMRGMNVRFLAIFGLLIVGCRLLVPAAMAGEQGGPSTEGAAPGQVSEAAEGAEPWLEILDLREFWSQSELAAWLNWVVPMSAVLLGLLAGRISSVVLGALGRRCERRGWTAQQQLFVGLMSPASLALFTLGLTVAVASIEMSQTARQFWGKTILLLLWIAVIWYASNLIFLVELALRRLVVKKESAIDRNLGPLISRTLRVILWAVGALFIAKSVFNQDVVAILATFGVATLAVTLAATDSLKNLFGSISILTDRPFEIGERIVFAGYDGIVEQIGFRSTKVRTLTGHLVTIPNAKIVNDPVENVARRPSIRRIINVTITYDTPVAKVKEAVEILRGILEEDGIREPIHAVIDGNESPPKVYFNDYNPESLNIFLIYWFAPPAYWDYLDHAQRLNLRILEAFEKAGIEFAFPTQTLYLAGDPKRQLAVEMLNRGLEPPG